MIQKLNWKLLEKAIFFNTDRSYYNIGTKSIFEQIQIGNMSRKALSSFSSGKNNYKK